MYMNVMDANLFCSNFYLYIINDSRIIFSLSVSSYNNINVNQFISINDMSFSLSFLSPF